MRLLPETHSDFVLSRLRQGASYREIAEEVGANHTTVSRFVREYLPDQRRRPVRKADRPPPKLLVVDIETMANLAWVWDVWDQNIAPNQIVKHKRTISWAAKWVGERKVHFASEFHTPNRNDMIHEIWALLDEAEGVIGYNSKRFDIRHLNTEFAALGWPPPSGFQHIDLYSITRREFAFGSNKLESVARRLGLGAKRETEGFPLWVKCEAGDADAWRRMKDYNINDVKLTERLFEPYRPWIPLRGRQSQKRLRRLVEEA